MGFPMKSLYAADIHENQLVDSLFLVSAKNHGVTKGGSGYLVLKLLDKSGEIEGRVWERAEDLGRGFERNDFVRVRGQATLYQGKVQIRIQDVMRVDGQSVADGGFSTQELRLIRSSCSTNCSRFSGESEIPIF